MCRPDDFPPYLEDQPPVPGGTTAIRGGKYVTEERAPGPPSPRGATVSREPYDPIESCASSLRSIDETLEIIAQAIANPKQDERHRGERYGVMACIDIVNQSLNTVRSEDDGESRSIKTSIAAREHVIRLLTSYLERLEE